MDYREILLRLTASVLIGLDRNLRGKASGIRTLGLVSLGACLLTMIGMNALIAGGQADPNSLSRVIQGLITGIGFLSAGVIVHENGSDRIRGLTTAASIWITAILGILCGWGMANCRHRTGVRLHVVRPRQTDRACAAPALVRKTRRRAARDQLE